MNVDLQTSSHTRVEALAKIRELFGKESAASVADLLLSPFIDRQLFLESTVEPGPSLWVVNRSDIDDQVLKTLSEHSIPQIASRAKEKLALRHTSLTLLEEPPELPMPLEEIPDYMIEDVLGHPLAPFEAIAFFATHRWEDARASAALSLTRRLYEHAPNWSFDLGLKTRLTDLFARNLVEDPSPYVRAYTARVPLLTSATLEEAARREQHPLVVGRLVQHASATPALLGLTASQAQASNASDPGSASLSRIWALDSRLTRDQRRQAIAHTSDELSRALHEWHLLSDA